MWYIVYRGGSYYLLRVHRRVERGSGSDFSTRVLCVTRVLERGKVGRMRAIDADALYEQLKQDEEMARNRVLDTESTLPYPNNLNPSYARYVAQMNERTRLKHMVADAPTVEERKTGKWINRSLNILYPEWERYTCSVCGKHSDNYDFCPNCGADMRGE